MRSPRADASLFVPATPAIADAERDTEQEHDLAEGAFRLKRVTYQVGAAFSALCALYLVMQVVLGNPDFGDGHLAIGIPLMISSCAIAVALRWRSNLRRLEWAMTAIALVTVLFWDVVNLVNHRPPEVVLGATEPLVITGCVLMAVTLPGRWANPAIWVYFLVHVVLSWANLSTFAWSLMLTNHVINDLVTALTIAAISLLSTYQRMMGAVDRQRQVVTRMAFTDELTGLANRRRATEYLEEHDEAQYLLIDIDDFKLINDQLGHACGDKVLAAIGRVFADEAPSSGLAARWGGEEFLVVLPGEDRRSGAAAAEHLRAAVASSNTCTPVTISVGVATKHAGQSPEHVLSVADRRMYHAKNSGKNQVSLSAPADTGAIHDVPQRPRTCT